MSIVNIVSEIYYEDCMPKIFIKMFKDETEAIQYQKKIYETYFNNAKDILELYKKGNMDTRHFNEKDIENIIEDILEDYTEDDEILTQIIRYEICQVNVDKTTLNIDNNIMLEYGIPY
jgi:hypothetical protein